MSETEADAIYDGLKFACVALGSNAEDDWANAGDALRQSTGASACADRLAARLLRDLVRAHERHPDARITIVASSRPGRGACDNPEATGVEPTTEPGGDTGTPQNTETTAEITTTDTTTATG